MGATGYGRKPESARQLSGAGGVDAWRGAMSARIAAAVPSSSSRYVQALALGDTRGLDDLDWETLRATGLTHLIAISGFRSEEHTSELQSLMRISYAVFCLKKKKVNHTPRPQYN